MDNLMQPLGNFCTTSGTLVAGTTTTITTSTTINYSINGIAYIKTAITNGATPTTDWPNGNAFRGIVANQGTVIVLALDSGGTVRAGQGDIEALDSQGAFVTLPQFPRLGDLVAPFGMIILKAASNLSGTWTFGSSNLSSVTGMTYTFKNLMTLPARPIAS